MISQQPGSLEASRAMIGELRTLRAAMVILACRNLARVRALRGFTLLDGNAKSLFGSAVQRAQSNGPATIVCNLSELPARIRE